MPGSGGSEATTGPLTGQISTAGQIHTEQESRKLVLQHINNDKTRGTFECEMFSSKPLAYFEFIEA